MLARAARSATRGRPPLGLGGSSGRNGSMASQRSSGANASISMRRIVPRPRSFATRSELRVEHGRLPCQPASGANPPRPACGIGPGASAHLVPKTLFSALAPGIMVVPVAGVVGAESARTGPEATTIPGTSQGVGGGSRRRRGLPDGAAQRTGRGDAAVVWGGRGVGRFAKPLRDAASPVGTGRPRVAIDRTRLAKERAATRVAVVKGALRYRSGRGGMRGRATRGRGRRRGRRSFRSG
jgi:hypothetical protein